MTVTHSGKDGQNEGLKTNKTQTKFSKSLHVWSEEKRQLVSDSGFLSSLDQQYCNSHKYHRSKTEKIFKDRPVKTIWELLSFAAQNMTMLLLFLCSECTTRHLQWCKGRPEHLTPSSCSWEGTDGVLQATICSFSLTPLRQTKLKKMLKVTYQ